MAYFPINRLRDVFTTYQDDRIGRWCDDVRHMKVLSLINACFPGKDASLMLPPTGRNGPFRMTVQYDVQNGWIYNTYQRIPSREWDRVIVTDGRVRICYHSRWGWFQWQQRTLVRVELWFDAGVGRGYEYIGRKRWFHTNTLDYSDWDFLGAPELPDPNELQE